MSNSIETKTLELMTVHILAPGATKETTKIRLLKGEKEEAPSVLVEVDPIVSAELKEVDLKVNESFSVEKRYIASRTKAKVKNGIITISIPVDSEKVQTINIEE